MAGPNIGATFNAELVPLADWFTQVALMLLIVAPLAEAVSWGFSEAVSWGFYWLFERSFMSPWRRQDVCAGATDCSSEHSVAHN